MWSLAAIVGIAAAGLAGICVYVIYGTKIVDWRYRAETEGIMRRRTENTLRQARRIVQELSQSVVQSEKRTPGSGAGNGAASPPRQFSEKDDAA